MSSSVIRYTEQAGLENILKELLDMSSIMTYSITMMVNYDSACDFGYEQTLLSQFLKKGIREYEEPTRKGTPKGDRIGFPRHKHAATLFMITALNQRQIAGRLGISHKLLLKWNMEPDYREAIERHCRDFVDILVKHLTSGQPGLKDQYPLTNDAEFYGNCVIERLFSALGTPKDITDVYRLLKLCWMLAPSRKKPATAKLLRMVIKKMITFLKDNKSWPLGGLEQGAMQSVLDLVDEVFLREDE